MVPSIPDDDEQLRKLLRRSERPNTSSALTTLREMARLESTLLTASEWQGRSVTVPDAAAPSPHTALQGRIESTEWRPATYSEALQSGAVKGALGVWAMVRHPIDNVVKPVGQLLVDAMMVDNERGGFRNPAVIAAQDPAALQRMHARAEGLKNFGKRLKSGTGPERVEIAAELAVGGALLVGPGKAVTTLAKTAKVTLSGPLSGNTRFLSRDGTVFYNIQVKTPQGAVADLRFSLKIEPDGTGKAYGDFLGVDGTYAGDSTPPAGLFKEAIHQIQTIVQESGGTRLHWQCFPANEKIESIFKLRFRYVGAAPAPHLNIPRGYQKILGDYQRMPMPFGAQENYWLDPIYEIPLSEKRPLSSVIKQRPIPREWLGKEAKTAELKVGSYIIVNDRFKGRYMSAHADELYAKGDTGVVINFMRNMFQEAEISGVQSLYLTTRPVNGRLLRVLENRYGFELVEQLGPLTATYHIPLKPKPKEIS